MNLYHLKLLCIGISCFLITSLFSVCPEMEVWSDGTHYRYLIKDWHTDYIDGRISIQQQRDIIEAALEKKSEGVFVIAEDIWTYPGTNPTIQKKYIYKTIQESFEYIQKKEKVNPLTATNSSEIFKTMASPLNLLMQACKDNGLLCYNVECRQALDRFRSTIPTTEKVSKEDVINDLRQHLEEISACTHLSQENKRFSQDLAAITTCASHENSFVHKILSLRKALLEAKTVHKIIEWKTIKHGFICEGKNHIEEIKKSLSLLGYKKIKNFGDATIWILAAQDIAQLKNVLNHALDLKSTFQEIFQDARKQNLSRYFKWYTLPIVLIAATVGWQAWLLYKKYNYTPRVVPVNT